MALEQHTFGAAATLEYHAADGIPSAATVQIFHPEDGSIVAATAATLPTATATTTADAPAYSNTLTVDAATALAVGQEVLVESTLGERMEATVLAAASTTLVLDDEVPFALATGSTVRDHVVTYAAGSSLEHFRGYRAKWTLTIAGASVIDWTEFDVVYQPFAIKVRKSDLIAVLPALRGRLGGWWRGLIPGARRYVYSYLRGFGHQPDQLRDRSLFTMPAAHWIALRLALTKPGGWYDVQVIKDLTRMEAAAFKRLAQSPLWIDADDDNVVDDDSDENSLTSTAEWSGFLGD
jgi:hypothetical protein